MITTLASLTKQPLDATTSPPVQNQSSLFGDAVPIPDESPPSPDPSIRYIGPHADPIHASGDMAGASLHTDNQGEPQGILDAIGRNKVSARQLSFAPDWIMRESFDQYMKDNGTGSFDTITE